MLKSCAAKPAPTRIFTFTPLLPFQCHSSNTGSPGPAVLPASAGRAADAGDPVFELIRAKLIQIRGPRARPCSQPRPALRRRPGALHLN